MGKSIGGVLSVVKGKVGPIVGYKLADKKNPQGIRAYNGDVKNPKTSAQNFQRAVFATATVAGVNFKDLVNHSFEGVSNGTESVREFVKANVNALRAAGTNGTNLLIKGNKSSVVAPYVMSRGSLGETNIVAVDGINTLNGIKLPTPVTVGDGDDAVTGWSLAQLRAVISSLEAGAEIAFYCLAVDPEQTAASFNGETQPVSQLVKERIVISVAAATMPVVLTTDGKLVEGAYDIATTTAPGMLSCTQIDGNYYLIYQGADNSEWGADGLGSNGIPAGVGFVVSQQPEAGKYLFTSSRMLPLFAESGSNAANSYGNVSSGSIVITSDYYLEQPLLDDADDEYNHGDSLANFSAVLSTTKGSKMLKAGQTISLKAVEGTTPVLVLQNFNDSETVGVLIVNESNSEVKFDSILPAGRYSRITWSSWTAGQVYKLTVTMGGVTQNYNFSFSE